MVARNATERAPNAAHASDLATRRNARTRRSARRCWRGSNLVCLVGASRGESLFCCVADAGFVGAGSESVEFSLIEALLMLMTRHCSDAMLLALRVVHVALLERRSACMRLMHITTREKAVRRGTVKAAHPLRNWPCRMFLHLMDVVFLRENGVQRHPPILLLAHRRIASTRHCCFLISQHLLLTQALHQTPG